MIDDEEIDDKIIALPFGDPTWNFYHGIDQLPPPLRQRDHALLRGLQGPGAQAHTTTSDALPRSEAVKVIEDCMQRV